MDCRDVNHDVFEYGRGTFDGNDDRDDGEAEHETRRCERHKTMRSARLSTVRLVG